MHLAFTVPGFLASNQVKDKDRLKKWRSSIRVVAATLWGDRPLLDGKLKCTILYFHEGDNLAIDDDNMAKPICDALQGIVYFDDSQIRHSLTILESIGAMFETRGASPVVLLAMSRGVRFVYVRIEDAPPYTQLTRRA